MLRIPRQLNGGLILAGQGDLEQVVVSNIVSLGHWV